MARFVFRLQPVLDQRIQEERMRQRAVAELERERLAAEGKLGECRARIASERAELSKRLGGRGEAVRLDIEAVRWQAVASTRAMGAADRAALELAGVLSRLQPVRAELLRATTRRKAMETLRDRQLEAWKREMSLRESRQADELNVMRARFANGMTP